MQLATIVNTVFGVLTILAQASVLALFLAWATGKSNWLLAFFRTRAVRIAFLVALLAMLGSVTYSEVLGYEPCKLCWIQRILMYPQTLILGLALWGRHRGNHALMDSSLILSGLGLVVSGYHYLLQLGIAPALPCSAVGYSAACSQRFVLQFGYITIPLMAFSAFLLIAVSLAYLRKWSDTEMQNSVKE